MKTRFLIAICGCLLAAPLVEAGAGAPNASKVQAAVPVGQPAAWMPHDMIVSLHNLPKRYSCDDLWYKFHEILLAVGARPDMKILAYQCERYSPQVHVQFATPKFLTPAQKRWMDIAAAAQTLRLGPENLRSWKSADCELMRQTKDELLAPITRRVVSFDLACAAPPSNKWHYNVTVQAIEPVSTPGRVATVAGIDPRPLER